MEIKRNTEITNITHDDLVKLFSTALYHSATFEVDMDRDFYNMLSEKKKHGLRKEDKMADIILNGGNIFVYDKNDDGTPLSDIGTVIDNGSDEPYVLYTINMKNIIDGLSSCANGDRGDYEQECFENYLHNSREFDQGDADVLFQNIVFKETIYG